MRQQTKPKQKARRRQQGSGAQHLLHQKKSLVHIGWQAQSAPATTTRQIDRRMLAMKCPHLQPTYSVVYIEKIEMRAFHTSSRNSQRGPPLARHKTLMPTTNKRTSIPYLCIIFWPLFDAAQMTGPAHHHSRSQQANMHEQPLAEPDTPHQLPKTPPRTSHQMPSSPTDI